MTAVQSEAKCRGRVWRDGEPQPDFEFDAISVYLATEGTLIWVDLCDPDTDLLKDLERELNLNAWAVEDAVAVAERTKASVYPTHTFLTVYAIEVGAEGAAELLSKHRISAFVLPRGLITVRLDPGFDMEQVSQRWDEIGEQHYGVGALVHGLLDVVVDGHFEAVQALDDRIEGLEDDLFDDAPQKAQVQRRTFQLRKDLVMLRRCVLPMRDVVSAIQHRRLDSKTSPELDPLYADLYDHVLRASEWTDSLRDMVSTIFETNLSLQDARLNVVMKKLTGWAAIIAVPTAVTGFYGQNVPYPGAGLNWGFAVSSLIIVVTVVVLYVMFKRREYL